VLKYVQCKAKHSRKLIYGSKAIILYSEFLEDVVVILMEPLKHLDSFNQSN